MKLKTRDPRSSGQSSNDFSPALKSSRPTKTVVVGPEGRGSCWLFGCLVVCSKSRFSSACWHWRRVTWLIRVGVNSSGLGLKLKNLQSQLGERLNARNKLLASLFGEKEKQRFVACFFVCVGTWRSTLAAAIGIARHDQCAITTMVTLPMRLSSRPPPKL